MKKIISLSIALLVGAAAMFADSVKILNKSHNTIGNVTYSYKIQESSRGCFVILSVSQDTDQYVSLMFATNKGGAETVHLRPYEDRKEVYIGLDEVPSKVYVVNNEARVE